MSLWKRIIKFLSDTSKTSTLLTNCDTRKWNLFLTKFMLIWPKMGRLGFSSQKDFRFIFWRLSFHLSFSTWLLDRSNFLLQIVNSSSLAILAYLPFFQKFLIRFNEFIAKRRDSDSVQYKSLRLKCVLMIFLLSTISIFNCSRWLVNWFIVSVVFPMDSVLVSK